MKIDGNFALLILKAVLCNEKVLPWLKEQAKKTDTPIDDTAINMIELLICGSSE